MVLQLPEAQFRELTWGREDVREEEDTRALTLESIRVISGDWQWGQTGATWSSLRVARSSKFRRQCSHTNSKMGMGSSS